MAKNNHFEKLDQLLHSQNSDSEAINKVSIFQYAETLSQIEGALVVVSDLTNDTSHIFNNGFAKRLGLNDYSSENSIWEKMILSMMSEQEQDEKFIAELRFFHYLRNLPKRHRSEYYLLSKLRFKDSIDVLHRMYYLYDEALESVCYAICIYSPLVFDFPGKSYVVNSISGMKEELTDLSNNTIISKRERQILQLISSGMKSVDIAEALNISKNTVSRHRQEILSKLHVKNSIEACRLAKSMALI
ncbi:MAG: helix-turn-helix transcriptional regulator [Paramuribaculum sp.]|nr:helix-turn-helix transcriptional regulator [Paramuribaculum sp.]MDE6304805.1 helix-turn-helix transcriptional regulator [Paramuribaculum sp.]